MLLPSRLPAVSRRATPRRLEFAKLRTTDYGLRLRVGQSPRYRPLRRRGPISGPPASTAQPRYNFVPTSDLRRCCAASSIEARTATHAVYGSRQPGRRFRVGPAAGGQRLQHPGRHRQRLRQSDGEPDPDSLASSRWASRCPERTCFRRTSRACPRGTRSARTRTATSAARRKSTSSSP